MSSGGGTTCCGAYVVVRYCISELFVFTDFAMSCGSPGHGPSALAVCCSHVCCHVLLCGAAAGCSHLGILPQAPYTVFARPLPNLAAVLPRSHGEHVIMVVCDLGCCTLFPGV
jgi:hypothetical protein